MNPPLVHSRFLPPPVCERLVDFFRNNISELGSADAEPSFSGRVIHFRRLVASADCHREIVRTLRAIRFLMMQKVREILNSNEIFLEETQLVVWPENSSQALHRDRTRASTRYASVIYLNDNFSGGETFFANSVVIRPETGTMIAFHGASEEHGVAAVRAGTRYTLPCWYTSDPHCAEPE